jgi:hypothetical protein
MYFTSAVCHFLGAANGDVLGVLIAPTSRKRLELFIAPPQTFSVKFGTLSGATCPQRERLLFFLVAAISLAAHVNSPLAETRPCRSMDYERNAYTICKVDLRMHTVRFAPMSN